ncbi:hypothetical protein FUAX_17230 [Fulvitalea axinellae]|uniref:Thioredoxin domain-containing protein n=1 Tax=Fulvitalea axinellae TaxID=1182444 RepID=A0AAU9CAU5_9BACT|nr:hypothetical protein FUAX_17230 [Fulvitalea axinellae]
MKQTRLLPLLCLLLASLSVFGQKKTEFKGVVKGKTTASIIIQHGPVSHFGGNGEPKMDTIPVRDGKFSITLNLSEPEYVTAIPEAGIRHRGNKRGPYWGFAMRAAFFIFPGERLSLKTELLADRWSVNAKGNKMAQTATTLRQANLNDYVAFDSLEMQLDKAKQNGLSKNETNKLFEERNKRRAPARERLKEYATTHLDEEYSLFLLIKSGGPALVAKYYDQIPENIRSGLFGDFLRKALKRGKRNTRMDKAKKLLVAGAKAPDFELESLDGKKVALSGIKADYIVLDFWGSWCGWCTKEFPELKKCHTKYGDRIKIVGVDCFDGKKAWKDAVEKHELPWLQLYNDRESENPIDVMYGVTNFPTKVILDKELNIVARYKGADPAFFKKLDELMGGS